MISPSLLERYLLTDGRADAARSGGRFTRRRRARSAAPATPAESVTLRPARTADALALARLQDLDGHRLPPGQHVVAVADGRLLAAAHVPTGDAVADPFEPTADLVELVRRHARTLRPHAMA
jgi:hypothetical protein